MNEHQEHLPRCKTCVWFKHEAPRRPEQSYVEGKCFRYPPEPLSRSVFGARPYVEDDDFCGEHLAVKT